MTPGRRLRRQGWQPRTLVWGASGILLLVSALVTWDRSDLIEIILLRCLR